MAAFCSWLPRSSAPGLGRAAPGRGDWKGGKKTSRRPCIHPVRQEKAGAAGAGTHPTPTAQPPAQVRLWSNLRRSRPPWRPARGLTTETRGPIPGAELSRSCPWWEVSVSVLPPPPRLGPPARCNEKRRSRCIPAAPGQPLPPPAPLITPPPWSGSPAPAPRRAPAGQQRPHSPARRLPRRHTWESR